MKKIFRNVVVLTVSTLMAGSFTACHKGTGSELVPYDVSNSIQAIGSKTLILKFNVQPESVTFNTKTYTKNDVKSDNAGKFALEIANAANGTVNVNFGTGFLAVDPVNVKFGTNEVVELNFVGVKQSTKTLSLTDIQTNNGGTVDNDDENKGIDQGELGKIEGTIDVPGNVTIEDKNGNPYTGNTDFSITVFTPVQTPESESTLTVNKQIDAPVLGVQCTPDGAYFTPNVDVIVEIPGAEGYDVTLFNSANKKETLAVTSMGNDKFKASIPHFSSWIYTLNANITKIETTQELVASGDYTVSKGGRTSIAYTKPFGFEFVGNVPAIVKQFVSILFGASRRDINSTFSFYAPSEGELSWKVFQNVRTYTFKSGNADEFYVKMYGSVTPQVNFSAPVEPEQPVNPEPVPTHNGGGSNGL